MDLRAYKHGLVSQIGITAKWRRARRQKGRVFTAEIAEDTEKEGSVGTGMNADEHGY
jgi:hypothetical protein